MFNLLEIMDSITTFDLFPTLPAELRLKIYYHTFPHRILQMGYDFPFPFLPTPHPDPAVPRPPPDGRSTLYPIRTAVPALFHVCHEARQLCLSTYIPFAYAYAHPLNDTLYISSYVASRLHQNMNWYYKYARPPLYPLAELEKVAVEFDWLDIRPDARECGGWLVIDDRRYLYYSPLLEDYLVAFAEFGLPKELLVVGGTKEVRLHEAREPFRAWKTIKFTEDPLKDEPPKSKAILQYVHDNWYDKREDSSWFRERLPDVRIVGIQKTGECLVRDDVGSLELSLLADEAAREWQKNEYDVHGREWDFSVDGSPYDKKHMEKALRKTRAEIFMSREHQPHGRALSMDLR